MAIDTNYLLNFTEISKMIKEMKKKDINAFFKQEYFTDSHCDCIINLENINYFENDKTTILTELLSNNKIETIYLLINFSLDYVSPDFDIIINNIKKIIDLNSINKKNIILSYIFDFDKIITKQQIEKYREDISIFKKKIKMPLSMILYLNEKMFNNYVSMNYTFFDFKNEYLADKLYLYVPEKTNVDKQIIMDFFHKLLLSDRMQFDISKRFIINKQKQEICIKENEVKTINSSNDTMIIIDKYLFLFA